MQKNKNLITSQNIKLDVAFELGLEAERSNVNNLGASIQTPLRAGNGQHEEEWQGEQGVLSVQQQLESQL